MHPLQLFLPPLNYDSKAGSLWPVVSSIIKKYGDDTVPKQQVAEDTLYTNYSSFPQ